MGQNIQPAGADGNSLTADRDMIRHWVETLFRHEIGGPGYLTGAAYQNNAKGPEGEKKPKLCAIPICVAFRGGVEAIVDRIADVASEAAVGTGWHGRVVAVRHAAFGDQITDHGWRSGEAENVIACSIVTLDLDVEPDKGRATAERHAGTPTLAIETGGRHNGQPKQQLAWRLQRPATTQDELAKVEYARSALVALTGGDATGRPRTAAFRLPGTWHTKSIPILCTRADGDDPDLEYDLDYLVARLRAAAENAGVAVDVPSSPKTSQVVRTGFRTAEPTPDEILEIMVREIPNDRDWKGYRSFHLALNDATHGWAREWIHKWAEKSDRYDPQTTDDDDSDVKAHPSKWLGERKLFDWLQEANPKAWAEAMVLRWYEPVANDNEADGKPKPLEPTAIERADWKADLLYQDKDKKIPRGNLANVMHAFRQALELRGVIAFDEFAHATTMMRPAPWVDPRHFKVRPLSDTDDTLACEWLQRQNIEVSIATVHSAIEATASENKFNPVADYLLGLEHDGRQRLDTWMRDYLGAEDTPLSRAFGWKTLVAGCKRALDPGCKHDTVLVLEGKQGLGKSRAADILGGAFFTDDVGDIGTKDASLAAGSFWVVELGEMGAMSRAKETLIKAFLSRRIDRFRPPYGRRIISVPRGCIFLASTNEDRYLRDATGGRRFWPVRVGELDEEAFRRDRDQLWAEAMVRYKAGAVHWLVEPELIEAAQGEQAARYAGDPWDDAVSRYLSDKPDASISEITQRVLGITEAKRDRMIDMRLAKILRTLGWERYQSGAGVNRQWRYRLPFDRRVVGSPTSGDFHQPPGG